MKLKKFIVFILATLCIFCLVACGAPNRVVFRQEGMEDIVFEVEKGGAFDKDFPELKNKAGYEVTWDKTKDDLKSVNGEIIVSAVYTPKTFRIFYVGVALDDIKSSADALGITLKVYGSGENAKIFQEVVFGTEYKVATHVNSVIGWTYNGTAFNVGEKFDFVTDISLKPETVCTVTFKQDGQDDIIKYVTKGQDYTLDLPETPTKTGYAVSWDKTKSQLTNITENVIVNLVYTPNVYKIYFDGISEDKLSASATALSITLKAENGKVYMEVTFDSTFTLPVADISSFAYWKNGDVKFDGGVYTIADNVTLTAFQDVDNDSNWSPGGRW